jgi:putative DNA methylase
MPHAVTPFALKDAPALIERLLPVQKLSAESYKEQMANVGKTLTALGSYWKGRKPLILNKACILGCLLPATDNPSKDLEIFEKLMAMDDESFAVRWKRIPKPKQILEGLEIANIADYFIVTPDNILPKSSPVNWSDLNHKNIKVNWRSDIPLLERRRLEIQTIPKSNYRDWVDKSYRPEEVISTVHNHIWDSVNSHLNTNAKTFPDLIEQLGIMRFGRRPKVADTFCGSGQIPFEAARLGCDVYASDLNPIACMLTWGAFKVVGGNQESRKNLAKAQKQLSNNVQIKIDKLGVETDSDGWRAKAFLYCLEVKCPQSGYMVPLLPSFVISKTHSVIAKLYPMPDEKRYDIRIYSNVKSAELEMAENGTIGRDSKYEEAHLIHKIDGIVYKTKLSTLRRDSLNFDGTIDSRIRLWEKQEFYPREDDLLHERLYCIEWMRPKTGGKNNEYQFRAISKEDLKREEIVREYVSENILRWQAEGWIPDMKIEVGGPPRYQGLDFIKSRGWTHWNHIFNPRQLMMLALAKEELTLNNYLGESWIFFAKSLDWNSRISRWNPRWEKTENVFYNQALNTLYNYGTRSWSFLSETLTTTTKNFPLPDIKYEILCNPATLIECHNDLYITDPPYGDAVKYDEILDFFIAWLRKKSPLEFSNWVWDSRRSLAIQGQDETFRRNMVAAYGRMTDCMADNGLQVIMFTHNAGSIWADMANIVWASGLQVSAAWYVVTETDSALREGIYVKGTVLLVCRKRQGNHKTTRDDLAWDLQEEVEQQVATLTGLNQQAKGLYRDENLFEDADIQMAGYAAALRVLTRYATIDGRAMVDEAIRPRVKGETTFVDDLISFAVATANQCLVPQGIAKALWDKLTGAERFYLKMIDLEVRGQGKLDNYQNFAKAFKVRDYTALMASQRANDARLKTALEFGRSELGETSQLYQSVLRAVLYAIMELVAEVESDSVIAHLALMVPNYYYDLNQRHQATQLADYLAKHLERRHPPQASAARVLSELIKNQRLG